MFEDLIKRIDELLIHKPRAVVAITGFAGSGKSTLADSLRDHYKIKDSQVIRLDNLYAPLPRGGGLFDDYDWGMVARILQDVRSGKKLQYTSRGFEDDRVVFDEPLPKVVIIEGIRLFRSEMMAQFDLSVWIDCPPELALSRAKARDLAQGADEAYMKRWDTEWGPKNKEYFDSYRPDRLASFIYKEFG